MGSLLAGSGQATDLLTVYQRALQNDPQLKEAEATRLASLESKPQALAALLPQLGINGTISREHDKGPTNQTRPQEAAHLKEAPLEDFPEDSQEDSPETPQDRQEEEEEEHPRRRDLEYTQDRD